MAIPDFQKFMCPLLTLADDGKNHSMREALDVLAKKFSLTNAERRELLPSGRQEIFANRIAWAKTHLRMAGLVEMPARGVFRITDQGLAVLRKHPQYVDLRVLREQPGYLAARNAKREKNGTPADDEKITDDTRTPDEQIASASAALRQNLGAELLAKLKTVSPAFFEKLVVDLLVRMGYGGTREDAGRAIGRSGDEGIDGIINEDRLGLDVIYIQAKKWENTVNRPEIQKFAGALEGKRANKGIFITTSNFSDSAWEYVKNIGKKISLIDGQRLWNLMIDFDIGTATAATYEIKKIDHDYFDEETG
ncbi:MAG: restriction endonuclease [Verrucomicrobiales bacterium]|jgi:restriction system protein|nr:restriction endonuclease [Verrucomicrobiales bacterium]